MIAMRSAWRTVRDRVGATTLRDIAMVCVADALVGGSFGAISSSGGLPVWVPIVMSVLVFAGGAQFAAVGVVSSGGSPLAAVVAALVLNVRMVPFGFAVADVLGPRHRARLVGAHLLTDESVAFALRTGDLRTRRAAFWTCGLALFVCWNLAAAAGAVAGGFVADTDALGLDAAFPAVLLALVVPALRGRATRLAAALGAVLAIGSTPVLPAGLPVVCSLLAVVATLGRRDEDETVLESSTNDRERS